MFVTFVRWFYVQLNRLIPVTIALYRYLLVCRNEATERFGKERLARGLNILTQLLPLLTAIGRELPNIMPQFSRM